MPRPSNRQAHGAPETIAALQLHRCRAYNHFVYCGSRKAQPARSRAFIDLVPERLVGNCEYAPSMTELRAAARAARTARAVR